MRGFYSCILDIHVINIKDITAGRNETLILLNNGTFRSLRYFENDKYKIDDFNSKVIKIAMGRFHKVFLLENNIVVGYNYFGKEMIFMVFSTFFRQIYLF